MYRYGADIQRNQYNRPHLPVEPELGRYDYQRFEWEQRSGELVSQSGFEPYVDACGDGNLRWLLGNDDISGDDFNATNNLNAAGSPGDMLRRQLFGTERKRRQPGESAVPVV